MTTTDTEALAKRAGHILFTDGPEQPAATARETCVLLDLLAAAEHRATRAEAQIKAAKDVLEESEARGPVGMTFNGTPFPAWISIATVRRALDGER